jgi:uncharacterized protein (TIGR04551 family)
MRTFRFKVLIFGILLGISAPLYAQETDSAEEATPPEAQKEPASDDDVLLENIERAFHETRPTPGWSAPSEDVQVGLRLEHRGMFRFRPDIMYRMDLNSHTRVNGVTIGTSRILPPLTENNINNEGGFSNETGAQEDKVLAGANMRFRYNPTLHLTSDLRVGLQLDILDNLVLGSTPEFDPNTPGSSWISFSNSQAPPEGGVNGFRNSVRVKQVYGEWGTPFGLVRVGRQAFDWGMGLWASGGQGHDDDFGDFVDRALLQARIPATSIYAIGFGDLVASGPTSASVSSIYAQPYDLSEQDDVQQYGFGLLSSAQTAKAKADRYHRLHHLHRAVVDWGLIYVHRNQQLDSVMNGGDLASLTFDELTLQRRDASLHHPSFWFRLEYIPAPGKRFYFEMETAYVFGSMTASDTCVNGNGDAIDCGGQNSGEQSIQQYGAALKSFYTTESNQLTIGLDAGLASGDNPDDSKLSAFHFDRDFRVDQILFREVLGNISNAIFVKPYVQWDFFEDPDFDLGVRADLEAAWALESDSTPGGAGDLGYELDLSVFYRESNRFRAGVAMGVFLPGAAFDLVEGYLGSTVNKEAGWAMRAHGHLTWSF